MTTFKTESFTIDDTDTDTFAIFYYHATTFALFDFIQSIDVPPEVITQVRVCRNVEPTEERI